MRKLRRAVVRHRSEKAKGYKTIALFRYLWKEAKTKKGYIAVSGGKQIKKQSMLRRAIKKLF